MLPFIEESKVKTILSHGRFDGFQCPCPCANSKFYISFCFILAAHRCNRLAIHESEQRRSHSVGDEEEILLIQQKPTTPQIAGRSSGAGQIAADPANERACPGKDQSGRVHRSTRTTSHLQVCLAMTRNAFYHSANIIPLLNCGSDRDSYHFVTLIKVHSAELQARTRARRDVST